MPEPLAPSARLNGAHPVPSPEPEPVAAQAADADQGDPLFWDRRFDDLPRSTARSEARRRDPSGPTLRERLTDRGRDLLADTRAGVVVLVAVAVVAGFVWYRMGAGGEAHGAGSAPASTSARLPVTTLAPTAPGEVATKAATGRIVVHVAGAVTKPGVVELPAGARLIDAIEAVGGALPDGDLDRLNLAAKLADGERVYVAKPGEADPGAGLSGAGSGAAGGSGAAATPGAKLNLNTATQAQLEELPGVGPAFAQAILAERQRRGSFTSVNDLRSVRGIGDKRFADLAPLVAV